MGYLLYFKYLNGRWRAMLGFAHPGLGPQSWLRAKPASQATAVRYSFALNIAAGSLRLFVSPFAPHITPVELKLKC